MLAQNSLTLGSNRASYIGDMPATGWHRHAAPVLLIGLSGRFALQLEGAGRQQCRSALIAAGVAHVFDPCGEQVAVLYLEPDTSEAHSLRTLLVKHNGVMFDVVIPVGLRTCMDAYLRNFDLSALLRPPLKAVAPIDDRIAQSLKLLRNSHAAPWSRHHVASDVCLSASRFNHLFCAEMGVSFRSYRTWSQVRLALAALAVSPRLTDAAAQGAFADSAHFSRMFRQTFGMTPSSVLKPLRYVLLIE